MLYEKSKFQNSMYKETSGFWSDVLRAYKLLLLSSQEEEGGLKINTSSYIHHKVEVKGQKLPGKLEKLILRITACQ